MKPDHTAFESIMRQAAREVSANPSDDPWAGIAAELPARSFPLWGKALILMGSVAAAAVLMMWLSPPPAMPQLPAPDMVLVPPVHTIDPETQGTKEIACPETFMAMATPAVDTAHDDAPLVHATPAMSSITADELPAKRVALASPVHTPTRASSIFQTNSTLLRTGLGENEIETRLHGWAIAAEIPSQKKQKIKRKRERLKSRLNIPLPLNGKQMRRQIGRDWSWQVGPEGQMTQRFYGTLTNAPNIWLPLHFDGGVRGEIAFSPHVRLSLGVRISNSSSLTFAENIRPGLPYQALLDNLDVPFQVEEIQQINILRMRFKRWEFPIGVKFVLPANRVRSLRPFVEVQALIAQYEQPHVFAEAISQDGSLLSYSGIPEVYSTQTGLRLSGSVTVGVERQILPSLNAQLGVVGGYRDQFNQFAGIQLSLLYMGKRGHFGEWATRFRSI